MSCRTFIAFALVLEALAWAGCSRSPDAGAPSTPAAGAREQPPGPPAAAGDLLPLPDATFHAAPQPLAAGAVVEDWPTFLGPHHDGICRERPLRKSWPTGGPPLVWERQKGSGYASPSVSGDRLILFHRMGAHEIVECLDAATGERRWHFAYPSGYRDRFGYNDGPRATPVIDGDRVFTIGAEAMLHCLGLESGELIWKRDLAADFALRREFFGYGSTPLVEGERLIVNVGAAGGPCVVALERSTGNTIWQAGSEWGASYASPVPADLHGRRRVLVFAGGESRPPTGGLVCLDPQSGHIDFAFPWRSRAVASVNASSPLVFGERVFISASYRTGGALLEVSGEMAHRVVWTTDRLGAHFSSSFVREGYIYGVDGEKEPEAAIVCIDAGSGAEVWRFAPELAERFRGAEGEREKVFSTHRCALLPADGHVLCLSEKGHLLWLELTPERHEVLARAWLFAAGETWTPPLVSRGLLYVGQNERDFLNGTPPRLLCYDLRGGE